MEQNLNSVLSPPSSPSSPSSSSSSEEDYINMEVDHHSSFNSSIFSQSTNKEFEFQSFSSSSDRDIHTTTSPADELFYMGKLLPLHLPPRLQMVHKILQKSATFNVQNDLHDEPFSTPLFTPSSTTPFESCNISPSDSPNVSMVLDPTQYLEEYFSGFDHKEKTKKPKKMNMIKQPSKMRWTSYIKSLFGKTSGCSDERSAAAAAEHRHFTAANGGDVKNVVPFGQIKCGGGGHRRSFSGAIKRLSKAKTASSSAGVNLNCKRSTVVSVMSSVEIDSPIQAAIAHCKRSQNSRQIV